MSTISRTRVGFTDLVNFVNDTGEELVGGTYRWAGGFAWRVAHSTLPGELGVLQLPQSVDMIDVVIPPLQKNCFFGDRFLVSLDDPVPHIVVGKNGANPGGLLNPVAVAGDTTLRLCDFTNIGSPPCRCVTVIFNPPMATEVNSITIDSDPPLFGPWTTANFDDPGTGIVDSLIAAGYRVQSGCTADVQLTTDRMVIHGFLFNGESVTVDYD